MAWLLNVYYLKIEKPKKTVKVLNVWVKMADYILYYKMILYLIKTQKQYK